VRAKAANLSEMTTAGQGAARLSTAALPQVHVLLADGDDLSRHQREGQLRTAGFRVTAARTGFEAIVKASCHMPDVILLDHSLSDIDAAETARLISTCPATSHIPVVRLLSGRPLPRRVRTIVRQAVL
jgi:CheY-like chemotaxis protein